MKNTSDLVLITSIPCALNITGTMCADTLNLLDFMVEYG